MFAGVNLANPLNLSKEELAAKRQETLDLAAAQAAERDRLIAEGQAAQAAENERLSLLTVPDYDEYWGLSEATKNWVNPFPARPGTVPGRYERFDYTVPGSGIAGGGNFAEAFDKAFSSQWKSPVAGLSEMQQQLLGGTGFIGTLSVADLAGSNLPPEARAVAEFNQALRDQQSRHRTYTTNKEYLQAFQTLGIDPSTITTPEALAAISPDTKAAVFDLVQRQLQAKNQRAKPFGFGDALGIGLSIGAAFAPGPWSAAALGASGAAAGGGDIGDIALAGGVAGLANFAGGKLGEAWDTYRAGQDATTASNVAALGGTPANLYNPSSVFGTRAATTGLGGTGITAGNLGSTIFNPAALGGIQGATALGTGAALGGTASNVFGALPATGSSVLRAVSPAVTTGITPGGRVVPFYDPSAGAIRGTTAGATALSSGRGGIRALSSEGLGRNIVHAGLSSAVDSIREPSSGMFGEVADQLPRVPTITYPDYDPVRSGAPAQAGFERTSNIGVPSAYGYVPTELTPETALPYGSGLNPYAPTDTPNFDLSPYFQGSGVAPYARIDTPNFDLSPYFQSPQLFHRGGGVVNVDSGARPMDQGSFYQTYESGSQQYSDNFGEGMGITYDRIEGTDIPPQSRLQIFETPPMGVGALNGTARDMTRYAYGGGVGSLNDTARTMTYAGGGIVRAAAMAWQPFKVKIKNQAIFGEFMGYTKTGKVRVLDQESGVEKIYPKSRVRRAYSDEPLPDEPVKKAVGGPIIKTAAELLKRDPAGFFNKSQFVVQEAKLPQATGQRWQQLFQDKGINKAELGGLGLLTFLGLSGDEPITKEAVAEFIDQNRLEVGEDYRASVKSDTGERIEFIATEDPMFGELNLSWPEDTSVMDRSKVGYSVVIDPQGNRAMRPANWRLINEDPQKGENSLSWSIADDDSRNIHSYTGVPMTLDEAKVRLISQLREKSDDPLIGGPLTPGRPPRWGQVILRSPAVDREKEVFDSQAAAELVNYREIALTDLQTGGLHKNTRELINKLSEQAPMAAFKPLTEAQTQPGGSAAHNFPENTLVHLRVTDRPVEINGVDHENVLYAEEFQSDWAQGAINRGILRPEDISRKAELLDKLSQIRVKYSTLPDFGTPEGQTLRKIARRESTEIEDEIMALDRKQAYSPFLESGDKKGSVDQSPVLSLAISRLLKEAVDNGQDYVVFSNYGDQVTRWGETKLEPIYQETIPNLAKKIVRDLGGYVKPKFKTKEKENKYYKQNPDKVGKEEDAFFGRTVIEPKKQQWAGAYGDVGFPRSLETPYSHLSANRFVVHITDAMAKKIREEGQPVLSRAAGGPIIKGGGVSSLNGIARNMTRGYANGGGVGSMNETARSMFM